MRLTRTLIGAAVGALLASACRQDAPPTPPEPSQDSPAPEVVCHPVDTTTPPTITTYEEGGITIHSFVAPDHSVKTATHVVETAEGLVVVDTQLFRGYAQQFREYVDGLGKPISHVIISHGHPDHYFGLEYFEDAPTYAMPATRKHMKQRHKMHLRMHREVEGECDAVTDRVRFVEHDLELGTQVIGGITFELENVRRAEDNDQLVIRIPQAKTLILQDLMATDVHGFTAAGMLDGWIAALQRYDALPEYTHVLAGHGKPVDHAGLGEMIAYLEQCKAIWDRVQTADELRTALHEASPERGGDYLVDLMAGMKFPATDEEAQP